MGSYYAQVNKWLWAIDPGFLRLKHAFKTVFAIIIALSCMGGEPLFAKMMAGLSCGFSMQGIDAKPFYSRLLQVCCFNLIYFSVFALGLLVRDNSVVTALVLISLGFSVNYLRRFGMENSVAPMMAWLLCFLATILPYDSTEQAWQHIQGLIIGLSVSAIAVVFIFPENYTRVFIRDTNQLFTFLAQGVKNMRHFLFRPEQHGAFDKLPFVQIKDNLNHLLEANQNIVHSSLFHQHQEWIEQVLVHQYGLANAYAMLIDAYHILKTHDYQLPRALRLVLGKLNRTLEQILKSVEIDSNYQFKMSSQPLCLKRLDNVLSNGAITEPHIVMSLLNLKLSFTLIQQHLGALSRGEYGT